MRVVPAVLRFSLLTTLAAACSGNPSPSASAPQPAVAPPAPAPAPAARPAAAPMPAPTPAAAPAPPAAPQPAAAPSAIDLSGSWSATVDVQGQSIPLDIALTRGPNGYTGSAAPEGQPGASLTTLRLDGNHVVMSFSAPEGEAILDGQLSTDRQAITGNISYNGQSIPFVARKRP
jgi:hypothetical protein